MTNIENQNQDTQSFFKAGSEENAFNVYLVEKVISEKAQENINELLHNLECFKSLVYISKQYLLDNESLSDDIFNQFDTMQLLINNAIQNTSEYIQAIKELPEENLMNSIEEYKGVYDANDPIKLIDYAVSSFKHSIKSCKNCDRFFEYCPALGAVMKVKELLEKDSILTLNKPQEGN